MESERDALESKLVIHKSHEGEPWCLMVIPEEVLRDSLKEAVEVMEKTLGKDAVNIVPLRRLLSRIENGRDPGFSR